MGIDPQIQWVFGLVVVAIGLASWRRGGKKLVLLGAAHAAFARFLLTPESSPVLRYGALAAMAIVLLAVFATIGRDTWRAAVSAVRGS